MILRKRFVLNSFFDMVDLDYVREVAAQYPNNVRIIARGGTIEFNFDDAFCETILKENSPLRIGDYGFAIALDNFNVYDKSSGLMTEEQSRKVVEKKVDLSRTFKVILDRLVAPTSRGLKNLFKSFFSILMDTGANYYGNLIPRVFANNLNGLNYCLDGRRKLSLWICQTYDQAFDRTETDGHWTISLKENVDLSNDNRQMSIDDASLDDALLEEAIDELFSGTNDEANVCQNDNDEETHDEMVCPVCGERLTSSYIYARNAMERIAVCSNEDCPNSFLSMHRHQVSHLNDDVIVNEGVFTSLNKSVSCRFMINLINNGDLDLDMFQSALIYNQNILGYFNPHAIRTKFIRFEELNHILSTLGREKVANVEIQAIHHLTDRNIEQIKALIENGAINVQVSTTLRINILEMRVTPEEVNANVDEKFNRLFTTTSEGDGSNLYTLKVNDQLDYRIFEGGNV